MRKGNNLYKRKDGRWEARVLIGHGMDGNPRYKYLYGDTYQMALKKKKDYEKNSLCPTPGSPDRESLLFRDTAILWMEESREKWKPSTYAKYQDCLEKYIFPSWGRKPLRDMEQEDYDQLMSLLRGRLKSSTMNTVNTILSNIIKFSLAQKFLERDPFSTLYSSSPQKNSQIDILTAEETEEITRYIRYHFTPQTFGILLALYGGIRLGELCALKWEDIDSHRGLLHIRKTLQRIRNPSPAPGEPKTVLHLGLPKNGRERTIPLHPLLIEIAQNYKKNKPPEHYILRDGRPMEPRVCVYHFKRILEKAEIRNINFHTLRHTFASNCVEAGMDIKALSEILGHSSVKITMDRYVHLSMGYKQNQMEVLKIPFFQK